MASTHTFCALGCAARGVSGIASGEADAAPPRLVLRRFGSDPEAINPAGDNVADRPATPLPISLPRDLSSPLKDPECDPTAPRLERFPRGPLGVAAECGADLGEGALGLLCKLCRRSAVATAEGAAVAAAFCLPGVAVESAFAAEAGLLIMDRLRSRSRSVGLTGSVCEATTLS